MGGSNIKGLIAACIRMAIDGEIAIIITRALLCLEGGSNTFVQFKNANYVMDMENFRDKHKSGCPDLILYEDKDFISHYNYSDGS
jgi:hypothetical protein